MPSDLTERLAAKLSSVREPWGFAWESESPEGQTYAELVADYAPTLLPLLLSEPELVAGLAPEVKREVLAALIGEPDLFWSQSNNEVGLPSVSEAADFCEMDAGDVQEFDVAKTLGKRWVAMLPTDAERDDGWEGGIGWLDGEATLFGSLEEAEKAMVERKAALSALHQELTEGGE